MEPFNPSNIYSQTTQQRKRANDNMDQDDEEMQQISSGPIIPANSAKVCSFEYTFFKTIKLKFLFRLAALKAIQPTD